MEVFPVLALALLLLSPFAASSSSPASNSSSQLFPSSSTPPSSHVSFASVNGSSSAFIPSAPNFHSPYDVSPRFNPSMAIIIVVLLSAFFFMGFFSVYVRRCTAEDEFDPSPNNGGGSGNVFLPGAAPRRQDRPPQGLDLVLVNNLPVVRFSALKRRKETECVVCLNDFEEGEALRLLPKCGHLFHRECIDMWLFSHTTCPLCRRGLIHDKIGSASLGRMAEEGNQSSRTDAGNVPVPVSPAPAAEVAIVIDDSTTGVVNELGTYASGTADSALLPVEDRDAGCSQCGSPILGVMETPTGCKRQICNGTGRELRRSHSTGHFLVRGARDRMSKLIASPSFETGDPSCSPLFLAIASSIHRTRSYTMLSDLESAQEEEQQDGADGWRFSFRRFKREAPEPNESSCTEPSSSTKGANAARSRSSSPSSSVRRTFKRLTGVERSVHISSEPQREFAHLAYVL